MKEGKIGSQDTVDVKKAEIHLTGAETRTRGRGRKEESEDRNRQTHSAGQTEWHREAVRDKMKEKSES